MMNSIQKRNLLLFIGGRLISLIGSGIQMIAIPLFILDYTGSGTLMGVFTMLCMIPMLLVAPLAGVLGDRWNRKGIAVYTDLGRGMMIMLLAWLAFGHRMNITVLFTAQIFISIMDGLFNTATAAMLADLVDSDDFNRANASKSAVDCLSMIIGPVVGGIIYGISGIQMVFFLNALSFILSALCEIFIFYRMPLQNKAKLKIRSFITENRDALSFINNYQGLQQLFIFVMIANFLVAPIIMVVFPYILKKGIGFTSQQYGYIMTSFMAGLLIGNVLIGSLLAKARSGTMVKTGLLIQGFLLMVIAVIFFPVIVKEFNGPTWPLFGVIAGSFLVSGVFNAMVNTPLMTNLQKMVPPDMRARFFAALGLITQFAIPVGSLIYGFLLDKILAHLILGAVGVLNFAITLFFFKYASPEAYEPTVTFQEPIATD
jgi:DHA3 family macrolide efflux protein-like MFS transporter